MMVILWTVSAVAAEVTDNDAATFAGGPKPTAHKVYGLGQLLDFCLPDGSIQIFNVVEEPSGPVVALNLPTV